jgi:hypothetical protein
MKSKTSLGPDVGVGGVSNAGDTHRGWQQSVDVLHRLTAGPGRVCNRHGPMWYSRTPQSTPSCVRGTLFSLAHADVSIDK